jgi:hypothetical protein
MTYALLTNSLGQTPTTPATDEKTWRNWVMMAKVENASVSIGVVKSQGRCASCAVRTLMGLAN